MDSDTVLRKCLDEILNDLAVAVQAVEQDHDISNRGPTTLATAGLPKMPSRYFPPECNNTHHNGDDHLYLWVC